MSYQKTNGPKKDTIEASKITDHLYKLNKWVYSTAKVGLFYSKRWVYLVSYLSKVDYVRGLF